jgi:hypothetical protein
MDIDSSGEERSRVAKTDRTDHIVIRHRPMKGVEGVSNSYLYLQYVPMFEFEREIWGDQHTTPYRSKYDHGGAAGDE